MASFSQLEERRYTLKKNFFLIENICTPFQGGKGVSNNYADFRGVKIEPD